MTKRTLTQLINYITFHTTRIKQITKIHYFIQCPKCQDIYLFCNVIGWTTTAHKDSVQIHNATVWVNGEWYRLTEHDVEIKEEECGVCTGSKTTNQKVKDFIASYRALCVRHQLTIVPEYFEDGLRIEPFREERMSFIKHAIISKEIKE